MSTQTGYRIEKQVRIGSTFRVLQSVAYTDRDRALKTFDRAVRLLAPAYAAISPRLRLAVVGPDALFARRGAR
jgi:hypothetical protein